MDFFKKKEIINYLELLPVGSIVKIKSDEKKYMIYSYNDSGDYIIYMYPYGDTYGPEEGSKTIKINEIEEVIFKGYESNERSEFLKMINSENGIKSE